MAGNHLNIGVGLGDATLWNSQPAIQNFTDILAQKKAQRDAERQQLINQIGQIDPSKIRAKDRDDYYNKFQDWQNSAIAAQQLPQNSYQKMVAQGQAQEKLNNLHNFISESKQEAENERQLTQDWIKNPHLFSDEAHQQIIKSQNSPMSSADFIPQSRYGSLGRYVDPNKVDSTLDHLNGEALKGITYSNPLMSQQVDKRGNKTGVVTHSERSLSPTDILANAAHAYDLNDDVKALIDRKYANIISPDGDPNKTKIMRLTQNAIDRGDLTADQNGQLATSKKSTVHEATTPTFYPNTPPDKFYAHYDYRLEHPTQSASNAPTPLTTNYVEPARVGGVNDVNKWLNLAPTAQFRKGEKPTASMVIAYQVINIPDQVQLDQKAVKANAQAKADYNASPEMKNKRFGLFGGTPVPYEQSQEYKDNPPAEEYKVIKPGYQETLDPNDPVAYHAKAGEISSELKIPVTAINSQAGGKGGRGVNPGITNQKPQAHTFEHVQTGHDSQGNVITIGFKNGKWYDTKTNKPVE